MSLTLDEIKKVIAEDMHLFENKFRQAMKSEVSLLDRIMHYIVKRKGKQMRPMFVFLTAGMNGQINESTHRGAALIELLHTATLVHDDVVDDSLYRRGFFSINALWKNKIAVLVGDYLLSKGLLLSVDHGDHHLLKIVSEAVKQMSEGELLQIEKARKLDIDEDTYFTIIKQKTASLIASCCACGVASVSKDEALIEQFRLFGEHIGIAFQINDDLLDFESNTITGKPGAIDIKERKLTLPVIHLLNKSSLLEKRKWINIIKKHNEKPEKVSLLLDAIKNSGGIEVAREQMKKHENAALQMLHDFPETEYKTSLIQLVQYTTLRKS
ncbi:MAG TPA: polyprenyl synthetase family protein [Bacteroidia bacterium]|nr:polyprenyl synthetase family protein [Bacteroidia bacterium]HNT79411.1 polyprenyl synthetase family protein [Bacteroidia bacterium]